MRSISKTITKILNGQNNAVILIGTLSMIVFALLTWSVTHDSEKLFGTPTMAVASVIFLGMSYLGCVGWILFCGLCMLEDWRVARMGNDRSREADNQE